VTFTRAVLTETDVPILLFLPVLAHVGALTLIVLAALFFGRSRWSGND
jgi:hypothetical protein